MESGYQVNMADAALIEAKYHALSGWLDEATLRIRAAVEARSIGRGGVSMVWQSNWHVTDDYLCGTS